ncbi:MAG: hypothetical protein RIQ72_436 [Candidatus Parcubacteria bacterium]|jgi:hypothetical protein
MQFNTYKNLIYKFFTFSSLLTAAVFGVYQIGYAAAPTTAIGFQGQLLNSGNPVNTSVSATFRFYDALTGGVAQGSLINKTVSVSNGYFGTQFTESDIAGIDFNQSLWLEVVIEGNTLTPRSPINSVPFSNKSFGTFAYTTAPTVGPSGSLYFDTTANLLKVSNGTSWIDVSTSTLSGWTANGTHIYNNNSGNIGIGTTTPSSKLSIGGDVNLTGALRVSGSAGTSGQLLQSTGSGLSWVSTSTLGLVQQSQLANYLTLAAWNSTTTDALTEGSTRLYFNNQRARESISSSVLGLTYSSSTGVLSLTSGYNIPLSASTTAWNDFYQTPSTRITAGTNLGWTGNTLHFTGTSSPWGVSGSHLYYSTGNVGIGTQTPSNAFHIASSSGSISGLRLGITSSTVSGTSTSKVLTVNSAGDVQLATVPGTENIVDFSVNTDPNTVGTTFNPNLPADQDIIYVSTIDNSSWKWNGSAYVAYTPVTTTWLQGGNTLSTVRLFGTKSNHDLPFMTNNTERLRIAASGNVGIGTSTPTHKLTIGGTTGNTLYIDSGAGRFGSIATGNTDGVLTFTSGTDDSATTSAFTLNARGFNNTSLTNRNLFNVQNNGVNHLTVRANGNVGIGTTTSSYRLDVNGIIRGQTALYVGITTGNEGGDDNLIKPASNSAFLNIKGGAGNAKITVGNDLLNIVSGNSILRFNTDASGVSMGTTRMVILNTTGNVGIGTTTPSQKLVVVGNAQFTGVGSGAYASDLNLTADGTLTTSASDIRLKENILELGSSTLSKLLSLKTYTFNWKSDSTGRLDIGMIAQEVESIFPEIVFTNPVDGYKGINYSRLSTLLLRGMQEQQVRIDKLEQYATFIKTKEVLTEKLCLGDEADSVCINKSQLRQLLMQQTMSVQGSTSVGGSGSSPTETESTNSSPETDGTGVNGDNVINDTQENDTSTDNADQTTETEGDTGSANESVDSVYQTISTPTP